MTIRPKSGDSGRIHSNGKDGPKIGISAPANAWQNVAQTALAQRYGVDVPTLESLRNSVNTPAVDPDSVVKTIGADGEERTTVKVILPRLSKYNSAGPELTRVT